MLESKPWTWVKEHSFSVLLLNADEEEIGEVTVENTVSEDDAKVILEHVIQGLESVGIRELKETNDDDSKG